MAYGDTPHDALLRSAWEDFCDRLKGAGDLVFRDSVPATALARAEGFPRPRLPSVGASSRG